MDESNEPFMRALAAAVRAADHPCVDTDGNINWSLFARDLPTIHYETFRKIKAGDRQLDKRAIEEIAKAAGVEPAYFAEYRLITARELYDPRVVGFDQALKNLREQLRDPAPARQRRTT